MSRETYEPDYERDDIPPSVKLLMPDISREDSNIWRVRYGDPQSGLGGCGHTPQEAMEDFDRAYARDKENSTG
jgi:hypothetical protein